MILACCSSVAKSCPTLCHPMSYSMPGSLALHYLLEFAQTHAHWVNHAIIQPSRPLLLPSPLALRLSYHQGLFSVSQLFTLGGQSIGVSASASVLPMSIQGWFPLGLTGLISLQSKGFSRVFSSTTIGKHQFFRAQPSSRSTSHIHTWLLENICQFIVCRVFFIYPESWVEQRVLSILQERTLRLREVQLLVLSHPVCQHNSHNQKPGFLTPSLLPGPLGCLASPRGPGAPWKATHTPVDLICVFQAATATVSSAKVPVSAPAAKSRFSSWKPSVSRNAGRLSLQTTLTTNARVSWRLYCILWKKWGQQGSRVCWFSGSQGESELGAEWKHREFGLK